MLEDTDAHKAQTRATFDRLAPDYDAAGPGCFAYFGRRLVESVGIAPGARVLDVATGRGAVLFPAIERAGPAGHVVGIDLAEQMVRTTNAEASARGFGEPARVMDAEQLDFPDASFSAVLCGFGVMFLPHLGHALSEFRRVLEPGGLVGISTWQVSQADDARAVLDQFGLGGTREPGWITDPTALADLLQRAGFADVSVSVDAQAFHYADLDEYWQTARSTGQRRRIDSLDPEQTARVRAALAKRLRPSQREDGLYAEAKALILTARRP